MKRLGCAIAVLSACPVGAEAATWTLNITGPIDIGSVVAAPSGATTFRVDSATGAVTVISGAGRRLSAGPARVRVDISCRPGRGVDNSCATTSIPIRIGVIGLTTGRARAFSAFNVTMETAVLAAPVTGSNPLTFTLAPLGANVVRTFYVGAELPVAGDESSLPTGLGENAFYVYALDGSGATSAGDTDKGKATVLRALSITSGTALNFGRIQLPGAGSSTITLDAGTGARTVSGAAIAYATPAPTRGAFTVAGEGGQQVSISVPAAITLNGPAASLSVNLTSSTPASATLPGALGAAGSLPISIGGSFTLTPATPPGAYSGTVTVSADYN